MQENSHLPRSAEAQSGTRRPGGRTARTRTAVLDATLAELAEFGYGGASLDRIAQRSNVAVSTIYRRWGTLEALIREVADQLTTEFTMPDTGDLEQDLRYVAGAIVRLRDSPAHRGWLDCMVSTAVRDPAARRTLTVAIDDRAERASVAVLRAIDRSEVPADTDPIQVIRWLAAPLYQRIYITGEPVDLDLAGRCAAVAAHAARAGLLSGFSTGNG
ncbi:TetR/AcrR family transcriptional regulator [Nocardia stercoris]|uniref:TetR/AcrR family transcriptional regulator n=1 Tax=Nocardia stercoris TaxID=2483361 RepID=A0A3M2L1X9_9NOCA|nr:TetR/AcrR family transcriptional regulator [Nocardia stercoris]RMI28548.1 TetR/AcrR family transcriptional regulator [Nocardia stercoris]